MLVDPLFVVGALLFLGYFSIILFEKTKIYHIISLIFIGILLSYFGVIDVSPTSLIYQASPFLASIALVLLLFDAGLNLNLLETAKEFPKAFLFTIVVFLLSISFTAFVVYKLFSLSLIEALLVGSVVGGTSSAIIVAAIERMKIGENIKIILTLESMLTDVLVVITSFLLMDMAKQSLANPKVAVALVANSFSTAFLIGIVAAFLWLYFLSLLGKKAYNYVLTIAFAFILYSFSVSLGSSGSLAIFIFALTLANAKLFSRFLPSYLVESLRIERKLKQFQDEITFFIRTYFFVYVGLIIPKANFFSLEMLSLLLFLTFSYFLIRLVVARLLITSKDKELFAVSSLTARGLASVVMASLILSNGINIPGFIDVVLGVVLFTNILTSIGIFNNESKVKAKPKGMEEQAKRVEPKEEKEKLFSFSFPSQNSQKKEKKAERVKRKESGKAKKVKQRNKG